MLRDYQKRAIDELYKWLSTHAEHPCVVMPTGSGKTSVTILTSDCRPLRWPRCGEERRWTVGGLSCGLGLTIAHQYRENFCD